MKLKICKMEQTHLAQVMTIEEVAFSSPWTEKAFFGEIYENNFSCYLVCIDEETEEIVVGYAGMWLVLDEIHITTIAVRDSYRGKRIGELMLQSLFQIGRAKGAVSATLEVRPSNKTAQELYERLGFKAYGIRKKYYNDNGEDAIVMWKEL